MNMFFDSNGITYVDRYGNKVDKPKCDFPYNYSPYVQYQAVEKVLAWAKLTGKISMISTNTLYKTDHTKYNEIAREVFGNEGQYWEDRSDQDIETFLQKWLNIASIKLIKVTEYCNSSSGYPYWHFEFYNTNEESEAV